MTITADPAPGLSTPVDLSLLGIDRGGVAREVAGHSDAALRWLLIDTGDTLGPNVRIMRDLAQDELWRREDLAREQDHRTLTPHVPAVQTNTSGVPDRSLRKDRRNIAAAFLARRPR